MLEAHPQFSQVVESSIIRSMHLNAQYNVRIVTDRQHLRVNPSQPNLFINLLQSFDNLGYVNVMTLLDQCDKFLHRIEWITSGPQDLLSLPTRQSNNASIVVYSIQHGYKLYNYYDLPRSLLHTYHTSPQVRSPIDELP